MTIIELQGSDALFSDTPNFGLSDPLTTRRSPSSSRSVTGRSVPPLKTVKEGALLGVPPTCVTVSPGKRDRSLNSYEYDKMKVSNGTFTSETSALTVSDDGSDGLSFASTISSKRSSRRSRTPQEDKSPASEQKCPQLNKIEERNQVLEKEMIDLKYQVACLLGERDEYMLELKQMKNDRDNWKKKAKEIESKMYTCGGWKGNECPDNVSDCGDKIKKNHRGDGEKLKKVYSFKSEESDSWEFSEHQNDLEDIWEQKQYEIQRNEQQKHADINALWKDVAEKISTFNLFGKQLSGNSVQTLDNLKIDAAPQHGKK